MSWLLDHWQDVLGVWFLAGLVAAPIIGRLLRDRCEVN